MTHDTQTHSNNSKNNNKHKSTKNAYPQRDASGGEVPVDGAGRGYVSAPWGRPYGCKPGHNAGCGNVQYEPQSVDGGCGRGDCGTVGLLKRRLPSARTKLTKVLPEVAHLEPVFYEVTPSSRPVGNDIPGNNRETASGMSRCEADVAELEAEQRRRATPRPESEWEAASSRTSSSGVAGPRPTAQQQAMTALSEKVDDLRGCKTGLRRCVDCGL